MLASVSRLRPLTSNGRSSVARIRAATSTAAAASATFGSSTANSSPPSRATLSLSRSSVRSRGPTPCSTTSPLWCPSVSLISLNRSRSMSSTAAPAAQRHVHLEEPAVPRLVRVLRLLEIRDLGCDLAVERLPELLRRRERAADQGVVVGVADPAVAAPHLDARHLAERAGAERAVERGDAALRQRPAEVVAAEQRLDTEPRRELRVLTRVGQRAVADLPLERPCEHDAEQDDRDEARQRELREQMV